MALMLVILEMGMSRITFSDARWRPIIHLYVGDRNGILSSRWPVIHVLGRITGATMNRDSSAGPSTRPHDLDNPEDLDGADASFVRWGQEWHSL
jgi:hypothetical protein